MNRWFFTLTSIMGKLRKSKNKWRQLKPSNYPHTPGDLFKRRQFYKKCHIAGISQDTVDCVVCRKKHHPKLDCSPLRDTVMKNGRSYTAPRSISTTIEEGFKLLQEMG